MRFNRCRRYLWDGVLIQLRQKSEQGEKLSLVTSNIDYRQRRACGAHISSTCQPEAAFNLSTPTQHLDPDNDDIMKLKKVAVVDRSY